MENHEEHRDWLQNYGIVCPTNCLCRDKTYSIKIQELRKVHHSLLEIEDIRKETANSELGKLKVLCQGSSEIKCAVSVKMYFLDMAFKIAIKRSETLNLAKEMAKMIIFLHNSIYLPGFTYSKEYEGKDLQSFPGYLKFDK